MRTTINLPDELMMQIKKLAVASRSTVTALIEDALRETLARRRNWRPKHVALTTYGKRGLRPGVDLDDNASMLDLMEATGDSSGR